MSTKIFISYSHKDKTLVANFAQQLALCGCDLWIDEKDLRTGGNYTTQILSRIYNSDIYMVFISMHSVKSTWVTAEIDFALNRKIEGRTLKIIPVRLDDTDIPVVLNNIDYLDARFSVNEAISKFVNELNFKVNSFTDHIQIAKIGFTITDKTDVEIGPFNDGLTVKDLEHNRQSLLNDIRKKAYGILMNFVSISDFDFSATTPQFMNGMYTEKIDKVAGGTRGSICEQIKIETMVFNPDEIKVNRLIKERLEILNVSEIVFGFVVPMAEGEDVLDIGKRCLQKMQNEYVILSYDNREGARIELSDNFYFALSVTEQMIQVRLSTKYDWQLARKMEDFSVVDFLGKLIS